MKSNLKQTKKVIAENQNELITFFNNELSETTNRFTPNNVKVKLTQTGFNVEKDKSQKN